MNSGEAKDAREENKRLSRELQAQQAERESIIEQLHEIHWTINEEGQLAPMDFF